MNVYLVVFESWLEDKEAYDYANVAAFLSKIKAEAEAARRNEQIREFTFDSYFVEEVGLFT